MTYTKILTFCLFASFTLQACAPKRLVKKGESLSISGAVTRLKQGKRLLVGLKDKSTQEGKFLHANNTTLFINQKGNEKPVLFADIESLKVRNNTAGSGGASVAIVLGVLGTLGGLAIHSLCLTFDESSDPEGCPGYIFAGLLGGAAVGGLIGAGLGAVVVSWETIYLSEPL